MSWSSRRSRYNWVFAALDECEHRPREQQDGKDDDSRTTHSRPFIEQGRLRVCVGAVLLKLI